MSGLRRREAEGGTSGSGAEPPRKISQPQLARLSPLPLPRHHAGWATRPPRRGVPPCRSCSSASLGTSAGRRCGEVATSRSAPQPRPCQRAARSPARSRPDSHPFPAGQVRKVHVLELRCHWRPAAGPEGVLPDSGAHRGVCAVETAGWERSGRPGERRPLSWRHGAPMTIAVRRWPGVGHVGRPGLYPPCIPVLALRGRLHLHVRRDQLVGAWRAASLGRGGHRPPPLSRPHLVQSFEALRSWWGMIQKLLGKGTKPCYALIGTHSDRQELRVVSHKRASNFVLGCGIPVRGAPLPPRQARSQPPPPLPAPAHELLRSVLHLGGEGRRGHGRRSAPRVRHPSRRRRGARQVHLRDPGHPVTDGCGCVRQCRGGAEGRSQPVRGPQRLGQDQGRGRRRGRGGR